MLSGKKWLIICSFLTIDVVFLAYFTVGMYFKIPPPLPFGLDAFAGRLMGYSSASSPTPPPAGGNVDDTIRGSANAMDVTNYIKRLNNDKTNPEYIVRVRTRSMLTEENGRLRGTGIIPADPTETLITFVDENRDGSNRYAVGIHGDGLKAYPDRIDFKTFEEIRQMVPSGTFIQLSVPTVRLPEPLKSTVISVLEAALKDRWNFSGLTVPVFTLDVAL